jgi:hypothetical protein
VIQIEKLKLWLQETYVMHRTCSAEDPAVPPPALG